MVRWIGTISLFCCCFHLDLSHGFLPVSYLLRSSSRLSPYFAMKSSEEAAIKAFTEYMVRAHEEKLRAIRLVEEAKDAEIQVRQEAGGKNLYLFVNTRSVSLVFVPW
jgi:hypothetical protein